MIKFSQVIDHIPYLPRLKAELSGVHADVVNYAIAHFDGTQRYKWSVIRTLNSLTYYLFVDGRIPGDWNRKDPLNIALVDDDECKNALGNMYLYAKDVQWDIDNIAQATDVSTQVVVENPAALLQVAPAVPLPPTDKSDLYLKPPTFPQFDYTRVWRSGTLNGDQYCIYESLPIIPTKQNEISVTTDPTRFTSADALALYPHQFIQTRSKCMYEDVPGLDRHPLLGLILPIKGFTKTQLIDNLVRYPHFFKLLKEVDGIVESFYVTIEIDGELHKTIDIWDTLPEAKKIPKTSEFIKEYVIRRYLLERDVKHIDHRYKLYGTLDPFLTLFAPPEDYIRLGYKNTEDIARSCIAARVAFKRSRNPILRRLEENA